MLRPIALAAALLATQPLAAPGDVQIHPACRASAARR